MRPEPSTAAENVTLCCRAHLYGKGCLMSTAAGSLACGLRESRATLISGSVCSPAWTQGRWSAQSPGEGRLQDRMASSLRLHSLSQCTIMAAWQRSACWSSSGVAFPLAGCYDALLPRARDPSAARLCCPLQLFSFAVYLGWGSENPAAACPEGDFVQHTSFSAKVGASGAGRRGRHPAQNTSWWTMAAQRMSV